MRVTRICEIVKVVDMDEAPSETKERKRMEAWAKRRNKGEGNRWQSWGVGGESPTKSIAVEIQEIYQFKNGMTGNVKC